MAYKEAVLGLADVGSSKDKSSNIGRDDRIHGSLLIINELIMNSCFPDEVRGGVEWVGGYYSLWVVTEFVFLVVH